MRNGWFPVLALAWLPLSSCDRPAAGPTVGEQPKRVIDAAEATRAETERKLEEQRQAIQAVQGSDAPAAK